MALFTNKQQEIGSNFLIIFVAILTKNEQEVGFNLLLKIFVAMLIKKWRNRVWFINIYRV